MSERCFVSTVIFDLARPGISVCLHHIRSFSTLALTLSVPLSSSTSLARKQVLGRVRNLDHLQFRSKSISAKLFMNDVLPVVTGCTAGIGREFALQLSKAGFKILLVARNEKELEKLQSELGTCSASVICGPVC